MLEYVLTLLGIAIFVCAARVIKGPTAPDRVLAADTINSVIIAVIVVFAVYFNNQMFADVAIVYAMISFLSTIAISKYLMEKRDENAIKVKK
ncbi:MAG: cation:proton antiporter [Candidatus Aenigmarchaeota archaeon]|nr:cation:proton antiporter [Candidatus Aenigmarchaeota archaeon]